LGIPCQQYIHLHHRFIAELVPKLEIINQVKDIAHSHFRKYLMIGIHFRDHDRAQDWEVVPPFDDSSSKARKFGEGASLGDFERVMNRIKAHFRDEYNSNNVRFFLASNNESAKDYLLSKFEGSVALKGGDYRRQSNQVFYN
jgi:hypothetical protein